MENKVDLSDLVIISRMEYDRIIEFKKKFYFENEKLRKVVMEMWRLYYILYC